MSLGNCRYCGGKPVATSARYCPHCGALHPNPSACSRIVAIMALVLAIVVAGLLLLLISGM